MRCGLTGWPSPASQRWSAGLATAWKCCGEIWTKPSPWRHCSNLAVRKPEARKPNRLERPMSYLYAAYIATWTIHIAYLGTLLLRYTRLKNDIAEFKGRVDEKN